MMSLNFGLFTQVSGSGPLGPLVHYQTRASLGFSLNREMKETLFPVFCAGYFS